MKFIILTLSYFVHSAAISPSPPSPIPVAAPAALLRRRGVIARAVGGSLGARPSQRRECERGCARELARTCALGHVPPLGQPFVFVVVVVDFEATE